MLKDLFSLGLALYFQKNNPQLGLKFLIEKRFDNQLPDLFYDWWNTNEKRLFDQCQQYADRGIHFTYPGCIDYPHFFLEQLEKPPLWLSYLGNPNWNRDRKIAVVGSRKISVLSSDWINEELRGFLLENPVSVVSGGARGIDQAAHLCSLRSGRPTYVFLPSGLARIYPRDLNEWQQEIIAGGGALLSEYWPDIEIKKHFFVERNRLIVALSDLVLIVQGENRSGTMLTARWAIEMGRHLAVIPGHPRDPLFSGNLHLLRSGVPPVMDDKDLSALWRLNAESGQGMSI